MTDSGGMCGLVTKSRMIEIRSGNRRFACAVPRYVDLTSRMKEVSISSILSL